MALMAHCTRGEEYIVGQNAHTYRMEGGGAAVLGGIQPQPLDFEVDGSLDLVKVALAIKPIDDHFARSKLFCLENTTGGKVLPLAYLRQLPDFCHKHKLACHMDGARVFNAAVALAVPLKTISENVDSISICLSKGLGTPMGSVLCGSSAFIKEARHWRKMLGGGMRQIGFMAVAGLYALDHHIDSLSGDHDNAVVLAAGLGEIEELTVLAVNTNMVFVKMNETPKPLCAYLLTKGIVFPSRINHDHSFRLVLHRDIRDRDISVVVAEVKNFFNHELDSL
jgi:threonine aldolase